VFDESLRDVTRIDRMGSQIAKIYFGKEGDFGWKIGHIKPLSEGGTDDLTNLEPLHWKNIKKSEV